MSTALPDPLRELNALVLQLLRDDDLEIDLEPYEAFMDPAERRSWFQAWTGNSEVDGAQFEVFGQDGTGGMAAFWKVREGAPLLEQPVVFIGSEGERAVIASSFADYLWLLAAGEGPWDACQSIQYDDDDDGDLNPVPALREFAQKHAPGKEQRPAAIRRDAQRAFPNLSREIDALCQ